VVDGVCNPLALVRGTPGKGAYEVKVPLAAGCHPYFFVSGAGAAAVSYPDSGALAVGVGPSAASCALFASTRSDVDVRCDGVPDAGPVGGTSGGDAAAGSSGAGGGGGEGGGSGAGGASPPDDATPGNEQDGGGAPGTGGVGGTGTGPDGGSDLSGPAVGGCTAAPGGSGGCRVAPGAPATSDFAALVLLILAAVGSLSRRSRSPRPFRRRGDV